MYEQIASCSVEEKLGAKCIENATLVKLYLEMQANLRPRRG